MAIIIEGSNMLKHNCDIDPLVSIVGTIYDKILDEKMKWLSKAKVCCHMKQEWEGENTLF